MHLCNCKFYSPADSFILSLNVFRLSPSIAQFSRPGLFVESPALHAFVSMSTAAAVAPSFVSSELK